MRYFWGLKSIDSVDYTDKNGSLLFDKALKKLGTLKSDEQYGYKFNPKLGGNELLENMDKMKYICLSQYCGST